MQKVAYTIQIRATREKIWNTLWEDASYREWTTVFNAESHAVSDWKEGSSIHFVDGKGNGMYSRIEKSIPGEYISFQHLGILKNGEEQPLDPQTQSWSGSHENYTLHDVDGGVQLTAEMDSTPEMYAYFKDKFPKALQKVKEIAERS